MSNRQPTGKFFLFMILLLGAITYFVISCVRPSRQRYEQVTAATESDTRSIQAVIIRDEQVVSMDSNSTLVYVASEGAYLSAGEEIAYVYSAGYSVKQMEKLETIRQSIRDYQTEILADIVDTKLDRLNDEVHSIALQLKRLVNQSSTGSLSGLVTQLNTAIEARRSHLSQNSREDTKLTTLYEQESKQESTILSWRSVETAPEACVVSFYLDGYEEAVNAASLDKITIDQMRAVLAGRSLSASFSRLTTSIYRLVSTGTWYVAALCSDQNFNPVTGQQFFFQMDGFEDLVYECTVDSVQKQGNDRLVILEVSDPLGPLLNQRSGSATISAQMDGLYVPSDALLLVNGQQGVRKYDGVSYTFVPVEVVLSSSGRTLVAPLVEGTLNAGDYVLVG